MSPYKPLAPCPQCGRVACKDYTHTKGYRARQKRPFSNVEKLRRARAVAEYARTHGSQRADGKWVAPCQRCGRWTADLTAQHVQAYSLFHTEEGDLEVWCRSCNSREGAALANARRQE